jgi:hypothetical protein
MPIDACFERALRPLADPGMGTENAGPLLYALVRMRRPRNVLAVGLGYSTAFILQALADNATESAGDAALLGGAGGGARAALLDPDWPHAAGALVGHCIGVDDFGAGSARRHALESAVHALHLETRLSLLHGRFEAVELPQERLPVQLAWIDAGHQLDYGALLRRCWPLLDCDGGLLALHYTYVDADLPEGGRAVMPGPAANEMKRQLSAAGPGARFELLNLVEPHKQRQGSVTLLRRVDPAEAAIDVPQSRLEALLYGRGGEPLPDLNTGPAPALHGVRT